MSNNLRQCKDCVYYLHEVVGGYCPKLDCVVAEFDTCSHWDPNESESIEGVEVK